MASTLVILHGWGSDLARWQPLKSLLSQKLPLLLPRLPEDKIRNTADFSSWLFQKTKNLQSFYLLGHSFGGQIAVNFASRYPQRVKKLILVNSAGIRRASLKSILLLPPAKLLRFLPQPLKVLAYRAIGETDYVKAKPVVKETLKLILKEDQQKSCRKIRIPTLLLWGDRDSYTPLWQGRRLQSLINNSQLVIIPGAKHALPFTHAEQIKEKILWFIGSN